MVRQWCGWLLAGVYIATSPVRAGEPAQRAVVHRAIQACGGVERLGKLDRASWRGRGTVFADGKEIGLNIDIQAQAFLQGRVEAEVLVDNKTLNARLVWTRNQGWFRIEDRTNDIPAEALTLLQSDWYAVRTAELLLPALKASELMPLGEVKIDDRPSVGLKIVRKGRPDLDVYFEKETGLPIRCGLLVRETAAGSEIAHEFHFREYKDFDGLKHFTKIALIRDGKKLIDLDLSEIKPNQAIEDGAFAKP